MVHPSRHEIDRLNAVATEMIEAAAADAHTVDQALAHNMAFSTIGRRPQSALESAIVLTAAQAGASRAGLWPTTTAGGGLDVISQDGDVCRTYRVKKARKFDDGTYDVVCGAGSSLLNHPEPNLLGTTETWVIGFVQAGDDHTIDEVFAGQVTGHHGNSIIHLDLSDVFPLTGTPTPPDFHSTDEDLDDDDVDAAEGDEDTGAA